MPVAASHNRLNNYNIVNSCQTANADNAHEYVHEIVTTVKQCQSRHCEVLNEVSEENWTK